MGNPDAADEAVAMSVAHPPKTLHVLPNDSACRSLRLALKAARRDEAALPFKDDLSCGPIDPDDPDLREAWWEYGREGLIRDSIRSFWEAVDASEARIVVWYGRHSAQGANFFLHWVHRLGERPYGVIDVTGLRLPHRDRHGRRIVTEPLRAVDLTPAKALATLFGTERALTDLERGRATDDWRRLRAENASFRLVADDGLFSAPADYFDASLLDCAAREWRKSARVVGDFFSRNWKPYLQVSDAMLARRLASLVDAGRLEAQGDLGDLGASEVRLPG